MPGWGWIPIAIGVAVIVALVLWTARSTRRTQRLRSRFGPEYDRTLTQTESKRDAEADLVAREKRRENIDVRPLAAEARDRYAEEWKRVQAQFVDDPAAAVAEEGDDERQQPPEDGEGAHVTPGASRPPRAPRRRAGRAIASRATARPR